jgi:hypothetical protein
VVLIFVSRAPLLGTSFRLFQNVSLGEWMYAMEHSGLRQSRSAFRTYAVGVLLVLLATVLRAVTSVTSNLTSANVSVVPFLVTRYCSNFGGCV